MAANEVSAIKSGRDEADKVLALRQAAHSRREAAIKRNHSRVAGLGHVHYVDLCGASSQIIKTGGPMNCTPRRKGLKALRRSLWRCCRCRDGGIGCAFDVRRLCRRDVCPCWFRHFAG
jgi:hypothetical protein